jgi:O-antigen/teichoic acid export membrane protein
MFAAAASILGLLFVWVDRIAVFWSSGVELYGKYVVLSGAVLFAAGIVNAVSQAFLPTLVRSVKGIGEPPAHVWQDQMRVSLVLCAPVCAFLFVDPAFVREFFFGQAPVPVNFENVVRCLSLYGYLSAVTRIINSFQVAYGRNEIASAFNVFSAVLYFPTVFVVAYYYGAYGVAIGSVAYLSIFLLCFVIVTVRVLKNFPGRDGGFSGYSGDGDEPVAWGVAHKNRLRNWSHPSVNVAARGFGLDGQKDGCRFPARPSPQISCCTVLSFLA